jgi:hypothetical protein
VRHAVLLLLAVILGALGVFILVMDIAHGGTLHIVSASVGVGALACALGLAIPLEFKTALEALAPALPFLRGKSDG